MVNKRKKFFSRGGFICVWDGFDRFPTLFVKLQFLSPPLFDRKSGCNVNGSSHLDNLQIRNVNIAI